jgi:hypothetical protein
MDSNRRRATAVTAPTIGNVHRTSGGISFVSTVDTPEENPGIVAAPVTLLKALADSKAGFHRCE